MDLKVMKLELYGLTFCALSFNLQANNADGEGRTTRFDG